VLPIILVTMQYYKSTQQGARNLILLGLIMFIMNRRKQTTIDDFDK
jgi:hypothetical protein